MGSPDADLDPILGTPIWGYPAEFPLVYKGFLHLHSPGEGLNQLPGTPFWGPISGPQSLGNISGLNGRQCDFGGMHLPGEALKWGSRTPILGPYFRASPASGYGLNHIDGRLNHVITPRI